MCLPIDVRGVHEVGVRVDDDVVKRTWRSGHAFLLRVGRVAHVEHVQTGGVPFVRVHGVDDGFGRVREEVVRRSGVQMREELWVLGRSFAESVVDHGDAVDRHVLPVRFLGPIVEAVAGVELHVGVSYQWRRWEPVCLGRIARVFEVDEVATTTSEETPREPVPAVGPDVGFGVSSFDVREKRVTEFFETGTRLSSFRGRTADASRRHCRCAQKFEYRAPDVFLIVLRRALRPTPPLLYIIVC